MRKCSSRSRNITHYGTMSGGMPQNFGLQSAIKTNEEEERQVKLAPLLINYPDMYTIANISSLRIFTECGLMKRSTNMSPCT